MILSTPAVDFRLTNCLFVPGLQYKLVLVGKLADKGVTSVFERRRVRLVQKSTGDVTLHDTRDSDCGLYILPPSSFHALMSTPLQRNDLLHKRLVHMSYQDMATAHNFSSGTPVLKMSDAPMYEPCRRGKPHQ